jgi:hypothetical protein
MLKSNDNGRMRVFDELRRSIEAWAGRGNEQPLTRWLQQQLDSDGALHRLDISDWPMCVDEILRARSDAESWPSRWNEPLERLMGATRRFARPNGTLATDFGLGQPVIASVGKNHGRASSGIRRLEGRRASPIETARNGQAAPPPTLWSSSARVLGILRASSPSAAEFVAVDHRRPAKGCQVELFADGRSWLGPSWVAQIEGEPQRAKPRLYLSVPGGELCEWSYRAGGLRVTHSVVMLRGRRMALMSVLFESQSPFAAAPSWRISLPSRTTAAPVEQSRALQLGQPSEPGAAQVLPIALPCLPYLTERGSFTAAGHELVLQQAPAGRRSWLPLLVSWDRKRPRKRLHWRVLTVSEKSRVVTADRAFAARLSWGRGESYVVYRSLGPAVARTFLGHHTKARFLFGLLTPDGTVTPIVKIEE